MPCPLKRQNAELEGLLKEKKIKRYHPSFKVQVVQSAQSPRLCSLVQFSPSKRTPMKTLIPESFLNTCTVYQQFLLLGRKKSKAKTQQPSTRSLHTNSAQYPRIIIHRIRILQHGFHETKQARLITNGQADRQVGGQTTSQNWFSFPNHVSMQFPGMRPCDG